MAEENEHEKSQLVTQICAISSRAIDCAKFHSPIAEKSPFINWYLVLRAYLWLSDNARRAAFDSERQKTIPCPKCNNTNPNNTNNNLNPPHKNYTHKEISRLVRFQIRMKELRNKLKDEANVIEKCLLLTASTRRHLAKTAYVAKTELPVFNPADYYCTPNRTTIINHERMEILRAGFRMGNNTNRCINIDKGVEGSPVFQYRPRRMPFMSGNC
ncbi:heat shock protein binding protein [Striga asiatica]|uniref:Heat shock protein binding protein n=1 Tax=Striga asiatica TaxID=4170 RepID=A0A5A7RI50_STRAF|nr:heat shock protein binding protein [Striga asiatica]